MESSKSKKNQMKSFSLEKSENNICEENCYCDLLICSTTRGYYVIINHYHYNYH